MHFRRCVWLWPRWNNKTNAFVLCFLFFNFYFLHVVYFHRHNSCANKKQKCISWKRKCRTEFIEFVMAIVVPIRISSHEFSPLNISSFFFPLSLSNERSGSVSWLNCRTININRIRLASVAAKVNFASLLLSTQSKFSFRSDELSFIITQFYIMFIFFLSFFLSSHFSFLSIRPYHFSAHTFALNWEGIYGKSSGENQNFHFVLVHEKSVDKHKEINLSV